MIYRYSLQGDKGYSFTAHNGTYWITFEGDGQDYFLNSGEKMDIVKKSGLMIIQVLSNNKPYFDLYIQEDGKNILVNFDFNDKYLIS